MKRFLKMPGSFSAGSLAIQSAIATALFLSLGAGNADAQRSLGIDVSYVQGSNVNWSAVRGAGISFAWAKADEGVTISDPDFVVNENNGKTAGVYMGAYHFAHPEDNAPGSEASHFWGIANPYIKADGKTFMPMLDMETFDGLVGASTYSIWANDWCSDIVSDAAGVHVVVKPVIYVSACNACDFNTSVNQWNNDIANYNGESPQTGGPWSACNNCDVWGGSSWDVWQYSDTGSVSGVPGAVDLDVCGVTLSSFVATGNTLLTNRKGMARTSDGKGYWIVASDGGVFSFGDANFYGSMGGKTISAPVVAIAARPQGDGYWLTGSDGGVYAFGNAPFDGSLPGLNVHVSNIVGIASTADGGGYWLVGADGGIYSFGDAPFNGSLPGLNIHVSNVVGMAPTTGNGYWLVGSDGGIYSFDANFYGSMGGKTLSAPVSGMSARPQSDGYWLTGQDGAIYAFGNAGYDGGMNGHSLAAPIVGVESTADGAGYWLVGGDGGIFSFGDAGFYGGANW